MVNGTRRRCFASILMACGTLLAGASALAQDAYPDRTIHLVVPFPAGGGGDTIGRVIATKLSEAVGQNVIVENKPGASTIIATESVVRGPADGYTLLLNVPLIVQGASLFKELPYDPLKDLTPVTDLNTSPLWLAVSTARVRSTTFKGFAEEARAQKAGLNYASISAGSSGHLYGAALNDAAHLNMVHVPYKGSSPAIVALLGGEVSAVFLDHVKLEPHLASGKVRLLAVTGKQRSSLTPDVPTLSELGYPGFEALTWAGIFVSSKTPPQIVERLAAELRKIVALPDVVARWHELGYEPGGQSQPAFAAQVRADYQLWRDIITKAHVSLD